MIGQTSSVVPSLMASGIIWPTQDNQPSVLTPVPFPLFMSPTVQYYNIAFPSLIPIRIIWPGQLSTLGTVSLQNQVTKIANIQYYAQTGVTVTAIIEWNIDTPFLGQIRQTALDRMDFAY